MLIKNYKLQGEKLPIVVYPDLVLTQVASSVESFDEELNTLVTNMLYTMYKAPGIGLAAPQIGTSKRIFVIDVEFNREKITNENGEDEYELSNLTPQVFINPVLELGEEKLKDQEGCLSLPGIFEDVERSTTVKVKYQDLNGSHLEINADEMLAICIQHEHDHLEGVVFIDHLSSLKKGFYRKKLTKAKRSS